MIKLLVQLFKSGAVVETVQSLFQTKIENIKIDFYKKLSGILASILLIIVISSVCLMTMLFLGIGIGFYLNHILESSYLGFIIVGGFCLILAWIMSFAIKAGFLHKMLSALLLLILDKKND